METFENSVDCVLRLSKEPSSEDKLLLYGLFKQATVGDVNNDCPSIFYSIARMKWHAWNTHRGKTTDQAKSEYIIVMKRLISEIGITNM